MSLAEDLDRLSAKDSGRNQLIRSLRAGLNGSLRVVVDAPAEPPAPREDARAPLPSEKSLELLDRASKGMAFLLSRYKRLEDHVAQLDAWSNAQIQAAEQAAERWKAAAAESDQKLAQIQRSMDVMVRRVEVAEETMRRDREALTILQDRIVTAFGFGSDVHDVLAGAFDTP